MVVTIIGKGTRPKYKQMLLPFFPGQKTPLAKQLAENPSVLLGTTTKGHKVNLIAHLQKIGHV